MICLVGYKEAQALHIQLQPNSIESIPFKPDCITDVVFKTPSGLNC